MKDYKILQPRKGYVVLKEIDTKDSEVLKKSGDGESRAMGRVVALPEEDSYKLQIDDLVVYNEYEGQELFKYGLIDEDHIIVIKENNILLRIDESNTQNDATKISKTRAESKRKKVKGSPSKS